LSGIEGHGPYGNEGGEANKQRAIHVFKQIRLHLPQLEASKERGGVQPKPFAKAKPPKS